MFIIFVRLHRQYNKKTKRYTVTKVKKEKDYSYSRELVQNSFNRKLAMPGGLSTHIAKSPNDPRNISETIHPPPEHTTQEIWEMQTSRF